MVNSFASALTSVICLDMVELLVHDVCFSNFSRLSSDYGLLEN